MISPQNGFENFKKTDYHQKAKLIQDKKLAKNASNAIQAIKSINLKQAIKAKIEAQSKPAYKDPI